MDRNVFMTVDDFVKINTELLQNTGLSLYCSLDRHMPYRRVGDADAKTWRAFDLLIGRSEDGGRILNRPARDVGRADQAGFVRVRYGGDDEYAIGSSWYGADSSDTMKLVNRELNKLLKAYGHKGVVNADGTSTKICDNYYWTDAALASGKNWHLFLGHGVRKDGNKDPGYRPKQE